MRKYNLKRKRERLLAGVSRETQEEHKDRKAFEELGTGNKTGIAFQST